MKLAVLLIVGAFIIGGCTNIIVRESKTKPELEQPATQPDTERVSLLAEVPFDFDKSDLTPEGRTRLNDLAANLGNITPNTIVVTGHSGSIGSAVYNEAVSKRRAEVVRGYLVSKGIEPNRIYTAYKGETEPIADNKTTEGRAKNNRVEIAVIGRWSISSLEPGVGVVPILFATNRARTGRNVPDKYFGDDEAKGKSTDRLTLGRTLVRVPPTHVKGRVEQPSWWGRVWEKISFRMFPALNPSIHFSFAYPIEELTDDVFRSELRQSLVASKSRSALLYVHGFANTFADAAYRTAQLSFDLQAEGI